MKNILTAKINELSKTAVLAELKDPQSLAQVAACLQSLDSKALGRDLRQNMQDCHTLLEKIILDEVPDSAKAMSQVMDTISTIQQLNTASNRVSNKKPGSQRNVLDSGINSTGIDINTPEIFQDSEEELYVCTDEEILKNFLGKQESVLEEMEAHILALEKAYSQQQCDSIKRLLHTLKGETGVLNIADAQALCHTAEDYLDNSDRTINADILLEVKDWLSRKFNHMTGNGSAPGNYEDIARKLQPATDKNTDSENKTPASAKCFADLNLAQDSDTEILADFIDESSEHLQHADGYLLALEITTDDMECINSIFRVFHTIKGVANFIGLEAIAAVSHAAENLLDQTRQGSIKINSNRIDVIFKAVDAMKVETASIKTSLKNGTSYSCAPNLPELIAELNRQSQSVQYTEAKKIGEVLVEQGATSKTQVDEALSIQNSEKNKRLGELLIERGAVTQQDVQEALNRQTSGRPVTNIKETIKVETDRLDRLVDTIGELVITEAMVSGDKAITMNIPTRSRRNLRQLDKITRELQEIGMSMRMVSLKSTFQKMARLVRDLARKSGKSVNLVTEGEDTELDKNVIESIGDPLVHMIRNAVDHGIEPSSDRVKNGKSPCATLKLSACQKGGNIQIEISDDGRGLDRDAILAKARGLGFIKADENLPDQEIYPFIFKPGFSTARMVTDISGRGVGMDVVKKNIDSLRGRVEIQSEKSKGTIFRINLPLTLAIMDSVVVRVGKENYILPTLSIVQSVRPKPQDINTALGRGETMRIHGRILPLFRLASLFNLETNVKHPHQGLVVVVEDAGSQVGLLVDELVGKQQTVIKSLGKGLGKVQGVSGGAIMSDGQVCLILDIGAIMELASNRNTGNKSELNNKDCADTLKIAKNKTTAVTPPYSNTETEAVTSIAKETHV